MKNYMHKNSFVSVCTRTLIGTAVSFVLLVSSAWSLPYTQWYVFGDSLADSGNNALVIPPSLRTETPITPGVDGVSNLAVPTYPYTPSDRYSNGAVWPEHFAASTGLSAAPSLAGGNVYAFAGATMGPAGSGFPYSLVDQVGMFLNQTGGVAHPDPLYVVEGGGNDLKDAFAAAAGGNDPAPIVEAYLNNLVTVLTTLQLAGAENIAVWNLPDLGVSPAIRALGPTVAAGAHLLTLTMNQALTATLDQWAASNLSVNLIRFDLFDLVSDIVAAPQQFGLDNADLSCALDPACASDNTIAATYFFWDGIHPTTAGHTILANALREAVPEPGSAGLVILGLLLIGRRNCPARQSGSLQGFGSRST